MKALPTSYLLIPITWINTKSPTPFLKHVWMTRSAIHQRMSVSGTRSSYYGDTQYADYPVMYVDWNQAKTYCEWRGARLPSEAK